MVLTMLWCAISTFYSAVLPPVILVFSEFHISLYEHQLLSWADVVFTFLFDFLCLIFTSALIQMLNRYCPARLWGSKCYPSDTSEKKQQVVLYFWIL